MVHFIAKHIPNTLTCCNLISGCIATLMAFNGNTKIAFACIIIGAIFDFFDGMSARLLKVSSPIGKELDSLADCITFGVAPSTMIVYQLSIIEYPSFFYTTDSILYYSGYELVPYFAYIMAAFSALRLAKFNLDTRQTTSFIGLPTPANALFWGSLLIANPTWIGQSSWAFVYIMLLILFSCYLLVSEIPMFALKFKHWNWKGNEIRYSFIVFTILILSYFGILNGWWIVIMGYFLASLILVFIHNSKHTHNSTNEKI